MRPAKLHSRAAEKKLPDWECFVTSFRQGSCPPFAPLKRLSLVGLPSVNNITAVRRQQVLKRNMNLTRSFDSMKKRFLKIVIGIVFVCILFVGYLYANNDIGMTSTNLEADIRSSQKIKEVVAI